MIARLELAGDERAALSKLAAEAGGRSPAARRARIILLAAEGLSSREICSLVGCSHQTVRAWRRRFMRRRLGGLRRPPRLPR